MTVLDSSVGSVAIHWTYQVKQEGRVNQDVNTKLEKPTVFRAARAWGASYTQMAYEMVSRCNQAPEFASF